MPVPELVIAGLALTAVGTGTQVYSSLRSASIQKDMLAEEQRQEEIRKRAMMADARRKQLETLRQSQQASAVALAGATNQGANLGSGLAGGLGQISGQTASNYSGIAQSAGFGSAIFNSNASLAG